MMLLLVIRCWQRPSYSVLVCCAVSSAACFVELPLQLLTVLTLLILDLCTSGYSFLLSAGYM